MSPTRSKTIDELLLSQTPEIETGNESDQQTVEIQNQENTNINQTRNNDRSQRPRSKDYHKTWSHTTHLHT